MSKIFEKITRREHYKKYYQELYSQQYLDNVENYLKSKKLKVQKTENLTINDSMCDHMLILSNRAFIANNIFSNSRFQSIPKDPYKKRQK